jgi:nitrite reductase/ring-hydroxylating ferredoxin subunit
MASRSGSVKNHVPEEEDPMNIPITDAGPRCGGRRLPVVPDPATPGLPTGWFVAASSAEVPRGRTLTTRFMSEELVLYRTASGEARAVSPHCPHLGAHLGRSGTVEGEALRCDFHHFRFDGSGACQKTGYGTRPPPAARLSTRPVRELHGLILVHHDPAGGAPSWEVPALDLDGWSPFVIQRFSLRGHPQETTENSVDTGHFSLVHGFREVRVLREAREEGPYLTARYAMKRGLGPLRAAVDVEFEVHVHGLGYSLVEVEIASLGLRTRQLVLATPTEPGRIDLRLGVSVEEPRGGGPLAALLPRLRAGAAARFISILYARDVAHDIRIWEHKRYLPRPALAAGDGPVGLYRRWASQFYPVG